MILLFSPLTIFSQDMSIKLYGNVNYFTWSKYNAKNKNLSFTMPTIAFTYSKAANKNFYELELYSIGVMRNNKVSIQYDSLTNNQWYGVTNSRRISLKYEYNYLLTKKDTKFNMFLGGFILPFYRSTTNIPTLSTYYKSTTHLFNGVFGLTPRIMYNISKRFYVDANFMFKMFSFDLSRHKSFNPSLTKDQNISKKVSGTFFPKSYTFKVGIGLKL